MKRGGFTLVELLIASTILFATLTLVAEGYRSVVTASARSSDMASLLAPLPLIRNHVQDVIRMKPDERVVGSGELLGVVFAFNAVSRSFLPPPAVVDPDISEMRYFAPRYRLYDVSLVVSRGRTKEEFLYQELAWLPELQSAVSP